MCCGQKREAARQQTSSKIMPSNSNNHEVFRLTAPTPPLAAQEQPESTNRPAAGWSLQRLRYLERSPIRVRGSATGKDYEFSVANAVRLVDTRDADALLQTRFFVRADGY
jgi:hypothetical protein